MTIIPNLSPLNLTDEVTPDEVEVVKPVAFLRNGRSFLAETEDVVRVINTTIKIKMYKVFFMATIS